MSVRATSEDAQLLLVFCSRSYDLDELLAAINRRSGGVPLTGCSTAGEIATDGPGDAGVVVTALDDRPAMDVYIERLDPPLDARRDSAAVTRFALTHPLGLSGRSGEDYVRFVEGANFDDGSIGFIAEVPPGSLAWFMEGDEASVLEATSAGIIELAHRLHLQTLAEGIETQEQALTLAAMNSELGHGFCFSRPLPADELEALLNAPARQRPGFFPRDRRAALGCVGGLDALR